MQEDNIEKIRALMAKTISNGATENEAMQAMALAKKLMSKHGISMADVKNKTVKLEDFVWGSNATKYETYATKFEEILAVAIAIYTNTKSINFAFENPTRKNEKRVKRNSRIMFFGHKIDVELAVYMLNVCNSALEREWALYRATRAEKIHGNKIKNFSIGMASRIYERIEELLKEEINATGTDLIVVKNAIVKNLFEEAIKEFDNRASGGLIKYDDDDSYKKGYESGDKVNIHRSFSDKKTLKLGKE